MGTYRENIQHQNKGSRAAGFGKWAKRQMNRWLRRLAKREPEDAPRKQRHCGYLD